MPEVQVGTLAGREKESRKKMIYFGNYREVLSHVKADLIFTSPPYNIGSKSPRVDGFRRQGKYDPKSYGAIREYPDSLPEDEYQNQQESFLLWCADHMQEHGTLVYNHKPRRKNNLMIHPAQWFLRPAVLDKLSLMEEIIWYRGSTHNHGHQLMWPTTERLYVFKKRGCRYVLHNDEFLTHRSDVWKISRAKNNGHNAPFPEALARSVIESWSRPDNLVCDPYSGSGTVAVVAEDMGRRFEGSEILRKYYSLSIKRLSGKTGDLVC